MADTKYLTVPHIPRNHLARIFGKIEIDPITRCWNWTAHIKDGYGIVWWNNTMMGTHRVLFAWLVGPVPKGITKATPQLDHCVCENRRCCNPAHLALVLPKVNSTRGSRGFAALNAKKVTASCGHPLPDIPDLRYGPGRRCVICTRQRSKELKRLKRRAEGRPERKRHAGTLL